MGSDWWALHCQQAEEPPALRAHPQRLVSVTFPVLSPFGCPQHHCGFSLRLDFFFNLLALGEGRGGREAVLDPNQVHLQSGNCSSVVSGKTPASTSAGSWPQDQAQRDLRAVVSTKDEPPPHPRGPVAVSGGLFGRLSWGGDACGL